MDEHMQRIETNRNWLACIASNLDGTGEHSLSGGDAVYLREIIDALGAHEELLAACKQLLILHEYLNEHQIKGAPARYSGLNEEAFAAMVAGRAAIAKAAPAEKGAAK